MFKKFVIGFGAVATLAGAATAQTMTGAGATFPAPVYTAWAQAYKAATGSELNYQAIGSGGGIRQIKAKTVDFGASDKPLQAGELTAAGLIQFPTVIGGVVPIVNIPGVAAGQLKLSGAVLGEIDRKIDDGLPLSGVFRSYGHSATTVFDSVTDCTIAGTPVQWNGGSPVKTCGGTAIQ